MGYFWQQMAATLKVKKRMNHGKESFVVDLRSVKRGRHFFDDEKKAGEFLAQEKLEIQVHGTSKAMTAEERSEYHLMRERLRPFGVTPLQAIDYYVLHHQAAQPIMIQTAIGRMIDAKRKAGKRDSYLRKLERHLEYLNEDPEKLVHEISRNDIETIYTSHKWSLRTWRSVRIDIQTFFAFAVRQKWCQANPCKDMEKIILDEMPKGILTPKQAKLLMETCAKEDKPLLRYFADQLFGGMRESEARALSREDVFPTYIHLPKTKTRNERFIEINETWRKWRGTEHGVIKNFWRRVNKVKRLAGDAMKNAGCPLKSTEKIIRKKKRMVYIWPKNCLRHSFCTYAAPMWGAAKAAEIAGHSESIQKKHYRRPVPKSEAEEFWNIAPRN